MDQRSDDTELGFSWKAELADGVLSIWLAGAMDISVVDECRDGLDEYLGSEERTVVLDLAGLTFTDSSGLRLIMDIKRWQESRHGELLISRISRPVFRLFEVSGLTPWFDWVDGDVPDHTHCPGCEGVLTNEDRCPHCGSRF